MLNTSRGRRLISRGLTTALQGQAREELSLKRTQNHFTDAGKNSSAFKFGVSPRALPKLKLNA